MVQVKICGLTRIPDAEAAIEFGADFLGFNFEPTSPRYLGGLPPPWLSDLPSSTAKVAVFGRFRPSVPLNHFDLVQATEGTEGVIKPLIQVLRIRTEWSAGFSPHVMSGFQPGTSPILLDAWHKEAYGGTGARVDWELAAEIVRVSTRPVILAGGLTPDNVAEAIRVVRPFGVDVSSGVESSPGVKDTIKVRDFIAATKDAH